MALATKIRFHCKCLKCQCSIIVAIPTLAAIAEQKSNPELCLLCNKGNCMARNLTDNPHPRSSIERSIMARKDTCCYPATSCTCHEVAPAAIEHPAHYNWFDIECMDVAQHFPFHRGNALKYIWRAGHKPGADEVDDLEKAIYCLQQEIARLKGV